jgi:hypothetical protein
LGIIAVARGSPVGLINQREKPMSCFRVLVIVFGQLITWVASQAVAQDATGTGSAAKPKPTDAVNIAPAAEAAPASVPGHPDFPDLTIPLNADVATLQNLVIKAKKAKPGSPEQYKAQQTAIKQASSKLMQTLDKLSPAYKQAEMDTIISSVALLTFFNDKDQSVVIKQVTDFLKGRKKLSIQDVQTGIMTAGMLELQPNKNPAREIYELINELLKDDDREEMQSLRLNMQAAVRRLNMLGSKFEFDAQTVDGQRITTADFAGKFVLVDMFAYGRETSVEIPL